MRNRPYIKPRVHAALALPLVVLLAAATLTACDTAPTRKVYAPAPLDSAILLFTLQDRRTLVAYSARDGSTRWTSTAPGDGYMDGPLYRAGRVFAWAYDKDTSHSTLVALRASDGHTLWRQREPGYPPRIAVTDNYVVLTTGTQVSETHLLILRASDGAQVHDITFATFPFVAADGDLAFACAQDVQIAAFRLDDGEQVWARSAAPSGAADHEGCVLDAEGGIVYAMYSILLSKETGAPERQPQLIALDERDGRLLWQKSGLRLPPFLHEGVAYLAMTPNAPEDFNVSLIACSTEDGLPRWMVPMGTTSRPGVVATNEAVVFDEKLNLRAVRAADGSALWQSAAPPMRYLNVEAGIGDVVFARSSYNGSMHYIPAPGTDTSQYLIALSAHDGQAYWQLPAYPTTVVVGGGAPE